MARYIVSEQNFNLLPLSQSDKFQVITPSKAIASYLKVPHYSLESLTQNIVRCRGVGIASTLMSRRLLQSAVRDTISTEDIEGTAKAFLPTIKDLLRSGIDLIQLQQNTDPRIKQLANLAIAYQDRLWQFKRIDAAQLYWQGVKEITNRKAYTFYGYFAPGKDELAIINATSGKDSILVLPLDDLYPQNNRACQWLESQGWELLNRSERSPEIVGIGERLQQSFKQTSTLPPAAKLNVYADLELEIRGILTQVKVLLSQGVSAKDIVLITRAEQIYGDTLIDIAWEYSLPLQITYEIPLKQTRIGTWIELLLEVIRDNFPFEATAKLLAHPLVKKMSPEIWKQARATHPQGLTPWQELGIDLSLLDLQGSYSRTVWVNRLLDILSSWNILENAKFWAKEIVAYYRLQSGLKELGSSDRQLGKQAFSAEISEILELLTIPAQPGKGGVELHNPTSILGTKYQHVFILGCAAGILPAAIADDPILDFHNRKQLSKQGLNITTAMDLALRETWDFYCLLSVPSQSITFSYPESIDRNPSLVSPYLSRLGLQPQTRDNLPLASIEEARRLYLRQPNLLPAETSLLLPEISHALEVENKRESAIAPDHYDGVIGISLDPQRQIFSASQLTQLGQCPFKWFAAKLLKLRELPEADLDLDAAIRGNLYHRCLELSLVGIKTASDLAKFNQQLAQAFATAEQELNLAELPGWSAQRQEHLNLLSLNLSTAEFLPPEREVVATETKFQMQWHGLELRGQVDRIDRTPAGLAVIDYKTSGVTPAGVKDDTGKANLDLQLAVYQDAIALQYPSDTIDTAAYYSLTKQKTISRPQKDPQRLAAFAEQVKTHLTQGHYPVAPDVDRKACCYCDYDLVCRKGDRLTRKPL